MNKQFLEEVLPIAIRRATFYFMNFEDLYDLIFTSTLVKSEITTIELDYGLSRNNFSAFGLNKPSGPLGDVVNTCPRLAHVTARFNSHPAPIINPSYPVIVQRQLSNLLLESKCGVRHCDEDFQATVEQLKEMRGLKSFHLAPYGHFSCGLF